MFFTDGSPREDATEVAVSTRSFSPAADVESVSSLTIEQGKEEVQERTSK